MISRRRLLGAAAGTGLLVLAPIRPSSAAGKGFTEWTQKASANGWTINPTAVRPYHIQGSSASVALRQGRVAAVLLHVARRWHYEIAPLDTGEGGGITGYTTRRIVQAEFESNYLSGTAIALHPTAYPANGSEGLFPRHQAIVRDILADCEGTVAWGADLNPVKVSHFEIVARPGSGVLARVSARLDTSVQKELRSQTAGVVADPAGPERRKKVQEFQPK